MKLISPAMLLTLYASAAAAAPAPGAAVQASTTPAALTAAMGPVSGSAQFQPGGSDVWFFARPGRSLPIGSLVKTEAGSYCLLLLSDGTKLRLGPQSNLRVAELSSGRAAMSLGSGRLESWVKRRDSAEFRAETPLFATTLPEGSFAAEILSPTSATLDVFSGDLKVLDSLGKSQTVPPGNRVEFDAKTGFSTPAPLPAGVVKPEEPTPEGPAKPAGQRPAPAVKPRAAQAPPASPAVAKPKKARPVEPPTPTKSVKPEIDSQL